MKVCPTCQQTYADESLNFCLNDGAVLVKKDQPFNAAPPETVFMNQPNPTISGQQSNPTVPSNWGNSPNTNQIKPKSRTWLWVLGIFGAIILICGGGFFAIVAIVANNENKNVSSNNSRIANTKNDSDSVSSKKTLTDDLSKWKLSNDSLGITDYRNNELYMTSKPGNYFLALMSGSSNFRTDNATTKVSVRNTTGAATQSGYGLMINNNMTAPLLQDYAFLIDSATQSYRVVKHQVRKETEVVKSTFSNAVKAGTETNVLEVRDNSGKMGFYINGTLVTTVEDKDGITSGVPGLYAGGAIPIAFSNLEGEK